MRGSTTATTLGTGPGTGPDTGPERTLLAAGALLCALELGALLLVRHINLDEGWYLLASRLVYRGELLYRDFAYTQTPLLPYVYGPVQLAVAAWGTALGHAATGSSGALLAGRITTVVLAAAAWALAAATARRLAGRGAGAVTLLLLGVSVYGAAYYTYTATYALAACLLGAAVYVSLPPAHAARGLSPLRAFVAATCACLAVATRLSILVALAPLLLYWIARATSWRQRLRVLAAAAAAALSTLGGTIGLLWLRSGERMVYDIVGFHTEGAVGFGSHLHRILRVLAITLVDNAVPVLLALAGLLLLHAARPLDGTRPGNTTPDQTRGRALGAALIAAIVLALFVVHLLPRTTDSYYNALQLPLLSALAAAGAVSLGQRIGGRTAAGAALVLLLALHGGLQARAVARQGIVSWPPHVGFAAVDQAVERLQGVTNRGDRLLTFNTHLALAAELAIPGGLEMSTFSYHPTWSDERARHYRAVNNTLLLNLIENESPAQGAAAAAFTSFDVELLYGERATLVDALQRRYRHVATVPGIGPHLQPLSIFAGPQRGDPTVAHSVNAALESGIALLGFDSTVREPNRYGLDGAPYLDLALYWRAEQAPGGGFAAYTGFVQLLGPDGRLVAGWDNPPCRRTCPTPSWQSGEWVRDEYFLPLHGVGPGPHTLIAGLYRSDSGARLRVLDAGRAGAGGDHLVLQTLRFDAATLGRVARHPQSSPPHPPAVQP